MGDLRLLNSSSCSSSRALLPFSAGSLKGCECILVHRDLQKVGTTRSNLQPSGSSHSSSYSQRNFQLRALLNDRRSSFSYRAGEEGHITKDEDDLNILERLSLAWRVLFPKKKKLSSPAEIAKQRLKMILISDRCSVNDNAKRKIVSNIVGALANFVEIESQDRVLLNVSADPDLGTVYSVSVPVRRVKPEYQDNGDDVRDDELRDGELNPLTQEKFEFPAMEVGQLELSVSTPQEGDAYSSSKGVQDVEG
ncbi:hypothetical protein GOP47_0002545 [Adiantum capillus-veneris]|uniref:Uncharacterized protein n=1 Tax=Adiantum capillus-veneris TaxID=13818 RepID=A0A9D4VAV7_ADICA|nr:hypothetical protein GOP47_0002545 [Adiantum capillus-veneris]